MFESELVNPSYLPHISSFTILSITMLLGYLLYKNKYTKSRSATENLTTTIVSVLYANYIKSFNKLVLLISFLISFLLFLNECVTLMFRIGK